MMTEVFFGSMAFSMGLLALTAGAWLTVNSMNNPNGGRLVGFVITILAILSLVFTSYTVAKAVFMQKAMQRAMYSRMNDHNNGKMRDMKNRMKDRQNKADQQKKQ